MDKVLSETIHNCRICDSSNLKEILDLGAQPPANSLRRSLDVSLPAIPLVLCRCNDCGTVQLTETVSPEYLFQDYVWVTGTSNVARAYSKVFYDNTLSRCRAGKLSVLEVASNDGTFLSRFREGGHDVIGVEPARNIAAMAEEAGIPTIAEFFGLAVARRVVAERGHADAVFARNVIPHVADVRDVIAGMAHCLADDGVGAIEFHRADGILEGLQYDSIYHEHLVYHSLHSIGILLERFGLKCFDAIESPISGGSWVVYFSKADRPQSSVYTKLLGHESRLKIAEEEPWLEFSRRCQAHREALRAVVAARKSKGLRLIGYGASARSSTMLNFCGIDRGYLDSLADRSPLKHRHYSPGTDILIVDPKDAFAISPDVVLLLAWNFQDEILAQIKSERNWSGEVIIPLPGEPKTMTI